MGEGARGGKSPGAGPGSGMGRRALALAWLAALVVPVSRASASVSRRSCSLSVACALSHLPAAFCAAQAPQAQPGNYLDRQGDQVACPAGTYADTVRAGQDATACTGCPAGRVVSGTGSAAESACSPCGAGWIAANMGMAAVRGSAFASLCRSHLLDQCAACAVRAMRRGEVPGQHGRRGLHRLPARAVRSGRWGDRVHRLRRRALPFHGRRLCVRPVRSGPRERACGAVGAQRVRSMRRRDVCGGGIRGLRGLPGGHVPEHDRRERL